MRVFLILIIFFSSLTVFGQSDSLGFTNKAEAKNQKVNGLKEGKWLEYLDVDGNITLDTTYYDVVDSTGKLIDYMMKRPSYRLVIYKADKPRGIVNEFDRHKKLICSVDCPRDGIITTFAGGGTMIMGSDSMIKPRDGEAADSAVLFEPSDVKMDDSNNAYIVDEIGETIRKVDARTGNISTIAGNGKQGYNGDNIPATSASFNFPERIVFDHAGNIYVIDFKNNRVRKITKSTGLISTVAGNGKNTFSGDGGPAINAGIEIPLTITVDSKDNIYLGDHSRVRKIDAKTGIINTIAGDSLDGFSGDGGLAINAILNGVGGLAFDKQNNLFIVDVDNQRIRKINSKTNIITTIAGSGIYGTGGDWGPAIYVQTNFPDEITIDSVGNIYFTDFNRIRKVDARTGFVTTIVGKAQKGNNGDGGPALDAELNYIRGITFDKKGNLYIADYMNHRVRKVTFNK